MYNSETEVIFPDRMIPALGNTRTPVWQELVERISETPASDVKRAALVLLMAQLCGCANCKADSFQALRGCSSCAQRTLRRYSGSDESLLERHHTAVLEVSKFLEKHSSLDEWDVAQG